MELRQGDQGGAVLGLVWSAAGNTPTVQVAAPAGVQVQRPVVPDCTTQNVNGDCEAQLPVRVVADMTAAVGDSDLVATVRYTDFQGRGPGFNDSTSASLRLRVAAASPSSNSGNLVLNPGFEQTVAAGSLPSLAGVWQGDAASTVPAEGGITPRGGAQMLKFVTTGQQASAALVSSQMWQIVDLRAWATAIDAGGVRVDASAWFNRVTGGPNTDRRFDLRVLAFDTTDAGVPQRYQANAALAVQAASVNTAGAAWQQASLQLVLPPQTRVVLVEIYAYEDVLNDAVAPEFDGHYADDVVLTLTLP